MKAFASIKCRTFLLLSDFCHISLQKDAKLFPREQDAVLVGIL